MKLIIISDIHDNEVNLKKALHWCGKEGISHMVCCGDVTNNETLGIISQNFEGKVYLVRGNIELYGEEDLKNYKNIEYGGRVATWKFKNTWVGACHEPYLIDKVLERQDCDIVFYGHTHKPWEETRGKTRIVNPGTLGGVFAEATFAVYNTMNKELELKRVNRL